MVLQTNTTKLSKSDTLQNQFPTELYRIIFHLVQVPPASVFYSYFRPRARPLGEIIFHPSKNDMIQFAKESELQNWTRTHVLGT